MDRGEGGERSETGEGLAAAQIFFQRGARSARWLSLPHWALNNFSQ
jgi:hypothetical protein